MRDPIGHTPASPSRIGVAIAATAALALMTLLLAFAASANAETMDALAAASEAAAPVQSVPPPDVPTAPVDVPESVEPEATPSPAPPELDPPEDLAETTTAADGLASQAQKEVSPQLRTAASAAVRSSGQVTESAGAIREDIARVTAPVMHSAETAARSVDRATSIDRDRVHALAHPAIQAVSKALRDVSSGLVAEEAIESLLPSEGPSEIGTGPLASSAVPGMPGGHPATTTLPFWQASIPERLLTPLGTRWEGAPRWAGSSGLLHAERPSVAALGNAGKHSEGLVPLDGDNPFPSPPGSPQMAASGSGGSSFVPIAALLALLALAAPAILRRLREVPNLLAPTSFVCALERPG